jgi:hypothetical protein
MSTPGNEFKKDKLQPVTQERSSYSLSSALRQDITERQQALLKIQRTLQFEAKHASNLSKYTRIAVIVLGAFAATREAADKILPPDSSGRIAVILTYTIMALAITVIGSIAAALRFADKAAELNVLVAECNICMLHVDCEMPREGEPSVNERAARKLIHEQNKKIGEIQEKAAKLNVIVPGIELDSAIKVRHKTDDTVAHGLETAAQRIS